jgi:hypothetical protein
MEGRGGRTGLLEVTETVFVGTFGGEVVAFAEPTGDFACACRFHAAFYRIFQCLFYFRVLKKKP